MGEISIDIVLLLPKEVELDCVKASASLVAESKNKTIELNSKYCLPHISLAMVTVRESDLEAIYEAVEKIINNYSSFELKIIDNENISELSIQKNKILQKLHEDIMNAVLPYNLNNATVEALYPIPAPHPNTLNWINKFAENHSFENYKPHITLGFGKLKRYDGIKDFKASTLAVCHLGNYCTCRKVLWKRNF